MRSVTLACTRSKSHWNQRDQANAGPAGTSLQQRFQRSQSGSPAVRRASKVDPVFFFIRRYSPLPAAPRPFPLCSIAPRRETGAQSGVWPGLRSSFPESKCVMIGTTAAGSRPAFLGCRPNRLARVTSVSASLADLRCCFLRGLEVSSAIAHREIQSGC